MICSLKILRAYVKGIFHMCTLERKLFTVFFLFFFLSDSLYAQLFCLKKHLSERYEFFL